MLIISRFDVLMQHLVSSLLVGDRPVHVLRMNSMISFLTRAPNGHLLGVTIADVASVQSNLLMMSM